jgi:hypothetical protein
VVSCGYMRQVFGGLAVFVLGSLCVQGGLITTAPIGGVTTQFAGGDGCSGGTDAGFTINVITGPVCFPNSGSFGFTNNGFWNNPTTGFPLIGINSGTASFEIDLGALYTSAGVFMNYASPIQGTDPTIEALDALGNVIESADLATLAPISTPSGVNAGAFRGFTEGSPTIRFLEFTGDFIAVDSVTLANASATPEPSTLVMMATGCIALIALRRRGLAKFLF